MAAPPTDRAAARTVAAPGVEQTAGFLRGPAGELFFSIHAPSAGAQASLVMCPPVLADHPFSYRREFVMAVELARRGVAVWRFHYAGTGHSGGSNEALSFDTMVADAQLIVKAASSAAGLPVTVGGTRCGAMVAATFGGQHPLVLWQAVTNGTAYLREGFRARMIADGGQLQRTPPTSAELLEELRREGRVELVGYSLHDRFHDDMAGRRLRDGLPATPGRVLVIDSRTADGAEPAAKLSQELHELGADVTTGVVGVAEGWWFHRTQHSQPAVVGADLAAVIGPWLVRAPRPAPIIPPRDTSSRRCAFIPAGEAGIFGLLTPPLGPARGEAALLLWGGGGMPAFGRNQVATGLARRLAKRGYHVLQVDYPGRGDSPGGEPADPIDEPSKQAVFAAARAAYRWLGENGLSRAVTIGSCQGAVAALNTCDAAPELTGLALLAPPIAERFESGSGPGGDSCGTLSTMHPRIRSSITSVVRARTPLLLAYGTHDEGFNSFSAAVEGELGTLLETGGDSVTLVLTEERIHGYMTVAGQEAASDIVISWLDRAGL